MAIIASNFLNKIWTFGLSYVAAALAGVSVCASARKFALPSHLRHATKCARGVRRTPCVTCEMVGAFAKSARAMQKRGRCTIKRRTLYVRCMYFYKVCMYYVYVCMSCLLIHMAKNSIQCPAAQYKDLTVVHFSFGTFDYFLASLAE